MDIVNYDFDLEMIPGLSLPKRLNVSKDDIGRTYTAALKWNGANWIPGSATAKIQATKPDGTVYDGTATISGAAVSFELAEELAQVSGAVLCQIQFLGSSKKIGSENFIIEVERGVFDPAAPSESELSTFDELYTNAQELYTEVQQYSDTASASATAAEASAEDAEEAADLATAAADSILVDVTDRTPYLFRQSGGGVETGDREYDTIVGGTVAWNQLIPTASKDFTNTITDTRANFQIVIRSMPAYNYVTETVSTAGMLTGVFKPTTIGVGINILHNGLTKNIDICQTNQTSFTDGHAYLYSINAESVDVQTEGGLVLKDIQIFDLTQMFGSTIANYIYSLEQATAGAGVAWFRQYFPEDYYEYNAGELLSVSGVSAHVMRDADENIIGNYPLDDSLTLRGIPKLDGGKLYYDGDTYESDGTVARKYGIVDMGTLAWGYRNDTATYFYTNINFVKYSGNWSSNPYPLLSNKYIALSRNAMLLNNVGIAIDGAISTQTITQIQIYDPAYTDVATFKTAMSGVYLVYELATPTTETADPFTNPQVVDQNGTEQYVTDSIVPVGHDTRYRVNLLDNLNHILKAPTADGTYTMKVTVSNGVATYSWTSQ